MHFNPFEEKKFASSLTYMNFYKADSAFYLKQSVFRMKIDYLNRNLLWRVLR